MIAVLLQSGGRTEHSVPVSLLPIADGELVGHQLGALAEAGIDTLVAPAGQGALLDYLQVHCRNGIAIRTHYDRPSESILVMAADTIPGSELRALLAYHERSTTPLTVAVDAMDRRLLGLFVVSPGCPAHGSPDLLLNCRNAGAGADTFALADHTVRVRSVADYLTATATMLAGLQASNPGLRRIAPSVWIRGAAFVSPKAHLAGDVLLGDNCSIGDGVHIVGPAVIAEGCMVCRGARIERSVLWPGAAVGSQACVTDSLVTDCFTVGPGSVLDHCLCISPATPKTLPLRLGNHVLHHSPRGLRRTVRA